MFRSGKHKSRCRWTRLLRAEPLEDRCLLAIWLDDGVLNIRGTNGSDHAVVQESDGCVSVDLESIDLAAGVASAESRGFAAEDVDRIFFQGLNGDDRFMNETSLPSRAYGGSGVDALYAGYGAAEFFGGIDDDFSYGGNSADTLDGGPGNDTLYGGLGGDTLTGGSGDDELHGGGGRDTMYGDYAANYDLGLFEGSDTLYGDGGDDTMYGRGGNDVLHGGVGNDTIHGDRGNDRVLGEDGADVLYGDAGNDGLFGGCDDDRDTLRGGADDDRYLTFFGDDPRDVEARDAEIFFENASGNWTDREILIVDDAFMQLQEAAGSTRILEDTTDDGPITFFKEAANAEIYGVDLDNTAWNDSYGRGCGIHMRDWIESDEDVNWYRRADVIHEIGHNWDSYAEGDYHRAGDGYWHDFVDLHQDSDSNDDYVRSYGRESRFDDWCTCWEAYFGYRTSDYPATSSHVLQQKLDVVRRFFADFA